MREDFLAMLRFYGFLDAVLSEEEWRICLERGLSDNELYGIVCDANASVEFARAFEVNTGEKL